MTLNSGILMSVVAISLAVLVTAVLGYTQKWQWTGMSEYQGKNPEGRPVSFWMWLSVLIVPATLGLGGVWFALTQQQTELDNQREQSANALEVQAKQAQDEALQAYLDQMSVLLLDYDLRNSVLDSPERDLARSRTMAVVGRLDPIGKGSIVQFLHESDLIQDVDQDDWNQADAQANNPIVGLVAADLKRVELSFANLENTDLYYSYLNGANLYFANLHAADLRLVDLSCDAPQGKVCEDLSKNDRKGAVLSAANLGEADLREADLSYADLSGADLSYADLSDAVLSEAVLSGANLNGAKGITEEQLENQAKTLKGSILPNGQKYEDWLKDR